MKQRFFPLVLVLSVLLLASCTGSLSVQQDVAISHAESSSSNFWEITLIDEQGAVTVEVTPISGDDNTLMFDVAMNTHSVDLGMNLAALTTLSNDQGATVTASQWDAPIGGGHHVAGTLIFPGLVDDVSLLEGATQMTLTIRDVAVPERIFVWTIDRES